MRAFANFAVTFAVTRLTQCRIRGDEKEIVSLGLAIVVPLASRSSK
jgi:hypothetical protein